MGEIVTTDSDVKEWKAAMDSGIEAVAKMEHKRRLEHKIAIEAACVTIEGECRLFLRHAGHMWWRNDALSIITRDYTDEAIEYLDLCGLIERLDSALGPIVRIRYEDMR